MFDLLFCSYKSNLHYLKCFLKSLTAYAFKHCNISVHIISYPGVLILYLDQLKFYNIFQISFLWFSHVYSPRWNLQLFYQIKIKSKILIGSAWDLWINSLPYWIYGLILYHTEFSCPKLDSLYCMSFCRVLQVLKLRYNSNIIKFIPIKLKNSVDFNIFGELYNHHHYLNSDPFCLP